MSISDTEANIQRRLIEVTSICADYCESCQNAVEMTKGEFVDKMLDLLPRIYWNFFDLGTQVTSLNDYEYFSSYVDEELYNQIKTGIERLIGSDDMFLETFEEDMKYSDTPIGASISEGLSDLFEPLFNFVSIVRDSEGLQITEAYSQCKEEFENYWSQRLCNVLRALNHIKYNNIEEGQDYDY